MVLSVVEPTPAGRVCFAKRSRASDRPGTAIIIDPVVTNHAGQHFIAAAAWPEAAPPPAAGSAWRRCVRALGKSGRRGDMRLPRKLEWQLSDAERASAGMVACDDIEFHPNGRETIRGYPGLPAAQPK